MQNLFSQFKNKLSLIIAIDIPNQENFIKKEKLNQIIKTIGIKSKTGILYSKLSAIRCKRR